MTEYVCLYCGDRLSQDDVFDYGGDLAHLVLPENPYYSAPGQSLPCGQVVPVTLGPESGGSASG